jgi:uncharacterized membrane protein
MDSPCPHCGSPLVPPSSDWRIAAGALVGGAALGASLGGELGLVVGAVLGAMLGVQVQKR